MPWPLSRPPSRRGPTGSWPGDISRRGFNFFNPLRRHFSASLRPGDRLCPFGRGGARLARPADAVCGAPPNSSKPNPNQTKPDQENGLGFSWIPSSNSGLFNGLRAAQSKKNATPRSLVGAAGQRHFPACPWAGAIHFVPKPTCADTRPFSCAEKPVYRRGRLPPRKCSLFVRSGGDLHFDRGWAAETSVPPLN